MLVRKTRGTGGLDVLDVDLDVDSWTRLITGGLSQEIIALPKTVCLPTSIPEIPGC